VTDSARPFIPGLPDRSVLYISVVTHPTHPLHGVMRGRVHPAPDLDLARFVQGGGAGLRRYFAEHVVDGPTAAPPKDLRGYRGVVIGCSLHYFNPDRAPLAPWQQDLVRFVRRVIVDEKLPYFGCCGGASLAHIALGGALSKNPKGPGIDPSAEGSIVIRTTEITLTDEGRSDPLFASFPPSFGMHTVASDYVKDLAPGCRALAHAADVPNQAIAYGDRVRLLPGLHPEMSRELLQEVAGALIHTGKFGTNPSDSDGMMGAIARITATPHANELLLANFLSAMCAGPASSSHDDGSHDDGSRRDASHHDGSHQAGPSRRIAPRQLASHAEPNAARRPS